MTQTRQVHQVKRSSKELITMFRAMAIEDLLATGQITSEEAEYLATSNMNWRGALDGGMVFTLDPVWPAES